MKIHEYQAKDLLSGFGVAVPAGKVANTVEEAVQAAKDLGGDGWVVKAQIHAGGRGKGGGVKLASSIQEVESLANQILGMQLVTPQTGPDGQKVRKLLITEACDIAQEYYAGVVLDRSTGRPVLMVSAEGGVEIEEVAAKTPEKIFKESIDPDRGLEGYQGRKLAKALGFEGKQLAACATVFQRLVDAYLGSDGSLAEINPLVRSGDGRVLALDAKFSFDDNAMYRQKDLLELRDLHEEDPHEVRASEFDLSYIKLDGSIGCMVNGAGLAMATLDIINHHGGSPANFLDVGGGATAEKVTEAFKIILEDQNVRAILVNIFGGIMKCDVIAEGILAAAKNIELRVPVVVRLEGTNVEKGKEILSGSGLDLISADGLAEAAKKAVELAAG
ncbi:MAG: ADP-forming succinate--CoA ligase subunit beta [Planctomycetota bacterium]